MINTLSIIEPAIKTLPKMMPYKIAPNNKYLARLIVSMSLIDNICLVLKYLRKLTSTMSPIDVLARVCAKNMAIKSKVHLRDGFKTLTANTVCAMMVKMMSLKERW